MAIIIKNVPLFITLAVLPMLWSESWGIPVQDSSDNTAAFVQVSEIAGARPVSRKEKKSTISQEKSFETSHKLPSSLTYLLNEEQRRRRKRAARAADAPAPAPAGSIRLDVKKLIERYQAQLKTSTTEKPKTKPTNNRRIKKDIEPSDSSLVLTTGKPAASRSLDLENIPLQASGSGKQNSRIQIKKGPNGQEYEYEYVYYYYDDDDEAGKTEKKEKFTNAHDGPQPNQIPTTKETKLEKSKYKEAANEVIPQTTRAGSRGKNIRQLEAEGSVDEERLPANPRFPPRGNRNLEDDASSVEENEAKPSTPRGRGRPTTTTEPPVENDNISEETQGTRDRTRANVRGPSLELVDSASFNTHTGTAGAELPGSGPSFPSELPSGPVRFLGATPNERSDKESQIEVEGQEETSETTSGKYESQTNESNTETETVSDDDTTTLVMDKVALDLYAILQGTQRLSGEAETESSDYRTDSTQESGTLDDATNEALTTPEETSSTSTTTTTTTTTTTSAPTTTTTTTTAAPEPLFGRNKFRGRNGVRKHGSTSTTSSPSTESGESKPKNRFSRPSFGSRAKNRPTTSEPAHESEIAKEDSKQVTSKASRPTPGRTRFGTGRTRPSTTTHAPSEEKDSSATRASPSRPRPTFSARGRGRSTTSAPAEGESPAESAASEASSTTARSVRPRLTPGGGAVRPLRPGPRINIGRGRPGASTTTTTAPGEAGEDTESGKTKEEAQPDQEKEGEAASPSTPEDNSPINKLRNRQRLNVNHNKPKAAAASAPVQVRRINPLLNRRKPGHAEPTSSEAPKEEHISTEAAADNEEATDEAETPTSSTTTTTEEPRGLSKLLAGRKRLASRQPAAKN